MIKHVGTVSHLFFNSCTFSIPFTGNSPVNFPPPLGTRLVCQWLLGLFWWVQSLGAWSAVGVYRPVQGGGPEPSRGLVGIQVGHWSPQMVVKSKGNPTHYYFFFLGGWNASQIHMFFFSKRGELHLFLGGNLWERRRDGWYWKHFVRGYCAFFSTFSLL